MTAASSMQRLPDAPNAWVDTETGVIYIGRDDQTVESILQEASAAANAPVNSRPGIDEYTAAIAAMLDAKAKERRYDNAVSIATYTGSGNAQWAAEAQTFVAWRDQIWTYCYAELHKVQNGQREQPTISDFLTELGTQFPLIWPA